MDMNYGEVIKIGKKVTKFKIGDRVVATVSLPKCANKKTNIKFAKSKDLPWLGHGGFQK